MIIKIKFKLLLRIKYIVHLILFWIYRFDSWHISPIESREYCIDVISYVNSKIQINSCVMEIGCGLGETINAINCENKMGYDLSKNVIFAAKLRHFFNRNIFHIGSFDSLVGKKIEFLIALNFLHDFDSATVSQWLKDLNISNEIDFIIVDEILDTKYQNNHSFLELLPSNFTLIDSPFKEYRYNRLIKIFKNNKA